MSLYCNCCGSHRHWSDMSEVHGRCKGCHYKHYSKSKEENKMKKFKEGDKVVLVKELDDFSRGHKGHVGNEFVVEEFSDRDGEWGDCYFVVDELTDKGYYFPDSCLEHVTGKKEPLKGKQPSVENPNVTVHEDKLSVQMEAMNNAYMAIQGILNAHADKNSEGKPEPLEKSFTFSDFDKSVSRTWKKQDFKDAVSNAALGLTGESGEVADLIKKAVYHGRGFSLRGCDLSDKGEVMVDDVKDELSDALFYVSALAQEFGFTLEEIALHNKAKLEKRYKEGFTTEESAQKADKHSYVGSEHYHIAKGMIENGN